MRRILTVLLCVLLFSACSGQDVLHDSEGKRILPSEWEGKWLVINYWAGWCEGCRLEMSALNTFYRQNNDASIVMYAVNFDGLRGDELKQAVKKMGLAFPALADGPLPRWSLPIPDVLPVTFIVGPDGKVLRTLTGPQTVASLQRTLHQLRP